MARQLRLLSRGLEATLYVVVAASALAIGAVHPWAYVPLWSASLVLALLLCAQAVGSRRLRQQLGPHRVGFHASGRWLLLEPAPDASVGWVADLATGPWPRPTLLWPGLALLAWAAVQCVPLPAGLVHALSPGRHHLELHEAGRSHPLSLDALATLRGMAFLAGMLVVHSVATVLAERVPCRRRFRSLVSWLGTALALVALLQAGLGARRIYFAFVPLESESFFGTFVNRNHFAAYMSVCALTALGGLARAFSSFGRLTGAQANARRRLVALGRPEGIRLVRAAVPVLLTVGALLASGSRGAALAFACALLVAAPALQQRRHRFPAAAFLVALLVLPLAWLGLDRLGARFSELHVDEGERSAVWQLSLRTMASSLLVGSGFNTFQTAVSRAAPLQLPTGAPPWPSPLTAAAAGAVRVAERSPEAAPGRRWYREAHNDYLQLAVETGLVGLALLSWAMVGLLRSLRDPWLGAAVAGLLFHSAVDFSLQIPAVAVLFFALCAYAARTTGEPDTTSHAS